MSPQVIPLSRIAGAGPAPAPSAEGVTPRPAPASPVAPASLCASQGGCGSAAGPHDLPADIWAKVKDHPCYSEEAHHFFARMHVAVAPACNIQCHYCNRKYDCANESRPGVVSERLTPEQAARKVVAVANRVPQLSVLGIAGPGDALADARRTFETFERVERLLPELTFCLSTNGLALPDHLDALARHRIGHVTITLNAVDPEIGARLYAWVAYKGRRYTGVEAARLLLERQLEGLAGLVERGILVKVNSVLVPGINDDHLADVNQVVQTMGGFLHNIMPLISDPAHGTHFGLTGQRGPTAAELRTVQSRVGGGATLMKHCRQCRADAIGLLGEDRGQDFPIDSLPAGPIEALPIDREARSAYRAFVEEERADRAAAAAAADAALADAVPTATPPSLRRIAVATKGGGRINAHFGSVTEFQVFEAGPAGVRFSGLARVDASYCKGGSSRDGALGPILAALEGIDGLLVAKIGTTPRRSLEEAGITVCEAHAGAYIEPAVAAFVANQEVTAPPLARPA